MKIYHEYLTSGNNTELHHINNRKQYSTMLILHFYVNLKDCFRISSCELTAAISARSYSKECD